MLAYALTIFAGAFLLFLMQPLIGKYILPWFGGGPGVWTTCLLFFQIALLAGYAYAHLITRWLAPRRQVLLHLALLIAAVALLPIIPADSWKPHGTTHATIQILWLLTATLGAPYVVLASTGPLLQQWFSRTHPGASPYRLYALSNAGSLLALVSYPFVFETHFTRQTSAHLWGWGLVAYGLGSSLCAWRVWHAVKEETFRSASLAEEIRPANGPVIDAHAATALQKALWILLPGCASVLLMATTNKLCQDVAVIPFLWIAPLALYLLSFVICFDRPGWNRRLPFTLALVGASAGVCWGLYHGADWSVKRQLAVYLSSLFACCLVCHSELYRLRPPPTQLTEFYLRIATGGALGGVFVAVMAPIVFTNYYELHWGIWVCAALFTLICVAEGTSFLPWRDLGVVSVANLWRWLACLLPLLAFAVLDWLIRQLGAQASFISKSWWIGLRLSMWGGLALLAVSWVVRGKFRTFRHWRFLACCWLLLGVAALGMALAMQARISNPDRRFTSRNFYGVLTVSEHLRNDPLGHDRVLQHGRIKHGLQFLNAERSGWPTTYYGRESGVGLALDALPVGHRRIGLVGLGVGTLTAYARPGDYVRIYEINPEVIRLANTWFSYLSNCAGRVEVIPGDARLSLEREPPQQFDLLALDAFSGDAIPVHLLTREAFEVYGHHLKTNGVLAVHISNHYLDLEPIVMNLARHFDYQLGTIDYDESDEESWLYSSTWVLLTRDESFLDRPEIAGAINQIPRSLPKLPLWTDDFASVFQILK